MSLHRWCGVFALVLLPTEVSAFPWPQPRLDAHGDLLPAGAICRLGSARFRHPGPLQAVVYSPDGKLVAGASADPPMVRIWERGTGILRDEWRFPDAGAPEQLAFGPAGRVLYAGRIPGRSVPWSARNLDRRTVSPVGPSADSEFSFQTLTPDGQYSLAVSGERVLCWDLGIGQQIGSFERPDRRVADIGGRELGWVAISHNRTHYVATRLIDAKELWTVEGDWDGVLPNQPAAFSADGRRVAIRTEAGRVGVYESATGKLVARVQGPDAAAVSALRLSPDGRTLGVSWKDKGAWLYDLPSGKERCRLPVIAGSLRDMAFAPDSTVMSTADPDGSRTLSFFDVARGTPVDVVAGHTSPVVAVAISPDGTSVACATDLGGDPPLIVWDATTGRARWAEVRGRFADVSFSPDGSVIAAGGRGLGNSIQLWDARSGRSTTRLDPGGDPVRSLVFARDGRLVAGTASRCRAWDWKTGRQREDQSVVPHGIDRVVVEPDGRRAIVTTPDIFFCPFGSIHKGAPDISVSKTLTGFALSPDGRLLATADGTTAVRLWEVLTGAEAVALTFEHPVAGLAFAPGGRTLALATGGGTLLYDLTTGAIRRTLPRGATADTLVAFSGDGRRLVTAGNRECTATVWNVAAVREPAAGEPLRPDELAACWIALADADPKVGYAAVLKLASAPVSAIPFLAHELGRPLPDGPRIARLIADLDHPRYAAREQATRALVDVGEQAVDALRTARTAKVTAEQAERIDGLLARLAGPKPSPDRLRVARAIAALELVGTASARAVILEVANGPPSAPRTREAKAALDR